MRFFLLKQDDRIKNFASISGKINDEKIWNDSNPIYIPYKVAEPSEYIYFLPFMEKALLGKSIFIASEKAKAVFNTYQSQIIYQDFGLGDLRARKLKVYYFMKPLEIDCLSDKTEFIRNNIVKKIVLDIKKIGSHKVFTIKNVYGSYLVVSQEVVETLLSRRMNEIKFIELECEV